MSGEPGEPAPQLPNAPPTEPVTYVPAQQPSSWPTVLGVIAIVVAGLGILTSVWAVFGTQVAERISSRFSPPNMQMSIVQIQKRWGAWTIISTVLSLSLAVLLLAAGIGLIRRRAWAPPLCRAWAVLKMLLVLAGSVVGYQIGRESFDMMSQQNPNMPALGAGAGSLFAAFGVCAGLLWGWALPVFLLIWLARRPIKTEIAEWR